MSVVDDHGLLLLRLGREDQFVSSADHRLRQFMQESSKPSDSSSSAIPEPFLTVGCEKKLRLTKEQSALLEDSFNEHTTLNPQQKLELAKHLNLRPRQVEVWFQNRRARTKVKKTEVDCELLRQYCETLREENRRLHRELQKLRSFKLAVATPMYLQMSPATLMLCPSCERAAVREADDGT